MRTGSMSLSELGDTLADHDQARLDEYFETVNLEEVVREGGKREAETLFIGYSSLWECRELSTTRSAER